MHVVYVYVVNEIDWMYCIILTELYYVVVILCYVLSSSQTAIGTQNLLSECILFIPSKTKLTRKKNNETRRKYMDELLWLHAFISECKRNTINGEFWKQIANEMKLYVDDMDAPKQKVSGLTFSWQYCWMFVEKAHRSTCVYFHCSFVLNVRTSNMHTSLNRHNSERAIVLNVKRPTWTYACGI